MTAVRIASTVEEREAIFRFRYEIYVREQGKALPAADHANGRLPDAWDEGAVLFYVAEGDEIVATMRVHYGNLPAEAVELLDAQRFGLPANRLGFVSKAMVRRDRRGSMAFAAMSKEAYETAVRRGIRLSLIHCRSSLVTLYERLGYQPYGRTWMDQAVGMQSALAMVVHRPTSDSKPASSVCLAGTGPGAGPLLRRRAS